MNDQSFLLIVAGLAFLAGIAISSLLALLRKPPTAIEKPHTQKPEPAEITPQYPRDAIHLWQDEHKQEVVLKIGSRIYAAGESLAPKEQKYIRTLQIYLQRWLDTPAPSAPVTPPTSTNAEPESPADLNFDQVNSSDIDASSSIVDQVNNLLQQKLAESPLKNKGVLLMELPNQGMVVMVGTDQYPNVDSVPDPEIKAIIQAAVKDWESQT
jgi:hypothetical protein